MLGALADSRERERRFLADASHELRTPLTSLIGNVEYVARHGADPEVIADLAGDAQRLGRLVDDLLALEREAGPSARAAGPARADRWPRSAAEHPDVELRVEGTATGCRRARRARAALRQPGRERRAPRSRRGRDRDRAGRRRWEALESTSRDEGSGFAPGSEEAAFDRFWRAEEARDRSGSGIGLAIVKATAERHGGSVRAQGSTVTVTLPIAEGEEESVTATLP